ncbi:unnamed protein product [Caenorhabditis sp. 36 PRJEB53466]|nr:unnamed protein product [Caenorhabditis sp. 36 PRJEB53466]
MIKIASIIVIFFTATVLSASIANDTECYTKKCTTSADCQTHGYCNTERGVCCRGRFGRCTNPGTHVIVPQIECRSDADCGSLHFCDRSLKVCCVAAYTPETLCPRVDIVFSLEPECRKEWGIRCPTGTACYLGHCCPSNAKTEIDGALVPLLGPFLSKTRCPIDVPRGAFCDPSTQKLALMGKLKASGARNVATGKSCKSNSQCGAGYVCVATSTTPTCFENPLLEDDDENWLNFTHPVWISLMILVPVDVVFIIVLCMINKHKRAQFFAF